MKNHFGLPFGLGALLMVSLGCSSQLDDGISAYEVGAHTRAIGILRAAELEYAEEESATRARYALYRGLTHLSLGDKQSAIRWLAEAKAWYDVDRNILDAQERGRLSRAWVLVGYEPGTWGSKVLAEH